MKKYNYSDIKRQFRLLLAAINEGQQSVDFDWYDCCHALHQVANARLNINDFLDFENMMRSVSISPAISNDTVFNYNHILTLKQAKDLAATNPDNVFLYFMWNNYIYDAKTGRKLVSKIKTDLVHWGKDNVNA
jgi:hypothetical protein